MGYADPAAVIAIVKGWHFGRYPAMRSARARERLTEVQPVLLDAMTRTADANCGARRLRQVPLRTAGGRAAVLAAPQQSGPAPPARRHHGHGAPPRSHPRPPLAPARCRSRSGLLRRRTLAGSHRRAGPRNHRRHARLPGVSRPRAHLRQRAVFPHRSPAPVGHTIGGARRPRLCAARRKHHPRARRRWWPARWRRSTATSRAAKPSCSPWASSAGARWRPTPISISSSSTTIRRKRERAPARSRCRPASITAASRSAWSRR